MFHGFCQTPNGTQVRRFAQPLAIYHYDINWYLLHYVLGDPNNVDQRSDSDVEKGRVNQ